MTAATAPRTPVPTIRHTKLFINNEWCEPVKGTHFETINPATGKAIAKVAAASPEDVDRAVKAARTAFESGPWGRMDAADRGLLMFRLADLVAKHGAELAALESLNSGKTITDSFGDIDDTVNTLRYYAGWADKIEGTTVPVRGNLLCYTLRQPVGVIGQIIPWNFPLVMLAWKWGPALACGNTIVIKPAEQTPLTALYIADLAREAGFPPGVVNVVNGMGETTGAALVRHPDVDKIAFTGHVDTAKIIQRAAADTLKRTTFELGGKNPAVVFADADLDRALPWLMRGAFRHAGQCCAAGSRLYVEESIHDEVVERVVAAAKARRVGDPFDPKTEQGPQISQEQLDKILGYVKRGDQEGARRLTGGNRVGDQGFFVQPTVFDKVQESMSIATEEVFGPFVSVLSFKSLDEAIERSNRSCFGLAAGVFTRDINKAQHYARQVRAGTVWVNCYLLVDTGTPFGGFRMSGYGRDNGAASLEAYSETKTVTTKLS